MERSKLAVFSLKPGLRYKGWYWLSDVYDSWNFAHVADYDDVVSADAAGASFARVGVRPFALLV